MASIYPYATPNDELVEKLNLQEHPEGGYFVETGRWSENVASPFSEMAQRPLGTTIYYLLTPKRPMGTIHRNKSNTMHIHHQGRAKYTIIHPPSATHPRVRIETVVMGTDDSKGETRQLLVGNAWKMSEIPEEDVTAVQSGRVSPEVVGCLITEVVVPGFVWEDHEFLTLEGLEQLFENEPDGRNQVERFKGHVYKA